MYAYIMKMYNLTMLKELMQSTNAEKDYSKAIEYLNGIDGVKADPEEIPSSM